MRIKVARTLALALLLGSVGMIAAQQQGGPQGGARGTSPSKQKAAPEKSKLEEMLAEALKNNPDIRVAAAKMAEAEAELNRTRLQVTQKVVTLYFAIETQKKTVAHQESKYKRIAEMLKTNVISTEEVAEARQALALVKGKLEELEAQLPALLGKSVHSETNAEALRTTAAHGIYFLSQLQQPNENYNYLFSRVVADRPKTTGPTAERLRKALQDPIKASFTEKTFGEILEDLSRLETIAFRDLFSRGTNFEKQKLTLRFEEALPVSAIMQALSDETGCLFFVRDYGIVATKGLAPQGAMTVEQFLHQKPAHEQGVDFAVPLGNGLPWNPPDNIEGKITKVSPDGAIDLILDNVDGLLDGHSLHLYRPANEPSKTKYLGRIRIFNIPEPSQLRVGWTKVMARAEGRLSEHPKVDDKVSTRLPNGVKLPSKKNTGKNPPAEDVEGLVKTTDSSGLMTLTIGSDAGLAKGHTLELFRLNPATPSQSKYLGTVRILEAEAHQSVAQPVGRLAAPPQKGDRVASRIESK